MKVISKNHLTIKKNRKGEFTFINNKTKRITTINEDSNIRDKVMVFKNAVMMMGRTSFRVRLMQQIEHSKSLCDTEKDHLKSDLSKRISRLDLTSNEEMTSFYKLLKSYEHIILNKGV